MPDLLNPLRIISGLMLVCQAILKILAKFLCETTTEEIWLKAAHALTHPFFKGPNSERSSGCKRCEEWAGRQKTITLLATAVLITLCCCNNFIDRIKFKATFIAVENL